MLVHQLQTILSSTAGGSSRLGDGMAGCSRMDSCVGCIAGCPGNHSGRSRASSQGVVQQAGGRPGMGVNRTSGARDCWLVDVGAIAVQFSFLGQGDTG